VSGYPLRRGCRVLEHPRGFAVAETDSEVETEEFLGGSTGSAEPAHPRVARPFVMTGPARYGVSKTAWDSTIDA
jgi:hypothetical protein